MIFRSREFPPTTHFSLTALAMTIYTTNKNVDPLRLEHLYFEYLYKTPSGRLDAESEEVEKQGVVHLGRRADWFAQQLTFSESHIEQAVNDGQTVGFCLSYTGTSTSNNQTVYELAKSSDVDKAGYIYLVCVDQQWTRQGIGRSLVYRTMAHFRSTSTKIAISEIASSPRINYRSIHLFEKAGWYDSRNVSKYEVDGQPLEYRQFLWRNPTFATD